MGLWSSKSDDGLALERVPVLDVDSGRGTTLQVAALVVSCTQWIEQHAFTDRNLYGEFAAREAVLRYRSALKRGSAIEVAPDEESRTVTSVLRQFLLNIPTGVFSEELSAQFTMYRLSTSGDRFVLVRGLLARLPQRHRDLAVHLAHHLHTLGARVGEAVCVRAAQFLVPARSDALSFMARHFRELFDTRLFGVSVADSAKRSLITFNPGMLTRLSVQRMRKRTTAAPLRTAAILPLRAAAPAGNPGGSAVVASPSPAGTPVGASSDDSAIAERRVPPPSISPPAGPTGGPPPRVRVPARDLVPEPLRACIEWLNAHALAEEGLYRVPGSKTQVQELHEQYDSGAVVRLEPPPSTMCAETACSLIKDFMRELPESEFTNVGMQAFAAVADLGERDRIAALRDLAATLPVWNRALLRVYFGHLQRVHALASVNKMTAHNLTIAIRPNAPGWQFCVEHAAAIFGPDEGEAAVEELDESALDLLLGKEEDSSAAHSVRNAVLRPKGPRTRAPGGGGAGAGAGAGAGDLGSPPMDGDGKTQPRSFFRRELQRRTARPLTGASPQGGSGTGRGDGEDDAPADHTASLTGEAKHGAGYGEHRGPDHGHGDSKQTHDLADGTSAGDAPHVQTGSRHSVHFVNPAAYASRTCPPDAFAASRARPASYSTARPPPASTRAAQARAARDGDMDDEELEESAALAAHRQGDWDDTSAKAYDGRL